MSTITKGMSVREIAREVGMSPMTVCRALNGGEKVKAETRDIIFSLIGKKGYKISKSSHPHILVNTSNIHIREDSEFLYHSLIWFSLEKRLKELNFSSELSDIGFESRPPVKKITTSSLVVFMKQIDDTVFDSIRGFNPGMRFLTIGFRRNGISSVCPDEAEGGRLAACHFHEKGHLRVGVFTQLEEDSFKMRVESFVSVFKSLNPSCEIEIIRFKEPGPTEPKDKPQRKALEMFFSSGREKPTGIFCTNCYATMVLYKFLRGMNFSIPRDISVLGYDNPEFYDLIDTPLSRVAFPVKEIGVAAANQISKMVQSDERGGQNTLIPVNLIDKDSVANLSDV